VNRCGLAVGVLVTGLMLGAVSNGAAQDPADVAWNDGDLAVAERLYSARLANDSSDVRALHRLALINAWGERYDPALSLFARLLSVNPGNLEARRDRARVLSWAGRFPEAIAAYDTLVTMSDNDHPARLGLAQVLAWAGDLDSSASTYRQLLDQDSSDLEARRGLARALSWSGDLVRAEREWRAAVATDANDVPSLVGLSQTLRWQGRPGAAAQYIRRGRQLSPDDRDVAVEWRYTQANMAPRISPSATYETDSDGNHISTLALRGAWRPQDRLELGVETYVRRGSWDRGGVIAQDTRGGLVEARVDFEPGWVVGAGAGASVSGADGGTTTPQWRASVSSPGRYHVGGDLSVRRAALDATALLMERGVVMSEVALSLRAEPATGWSLAAGASRATLSGTADNRRLAASFIATKVLTRMWSTGARVRGFGFQYDLNDGYFDPNRYLIAEALLRWRRNLPTWTLRAEVAGGAQQIGRGGTVRATAQASASASYVIAPGREIGLSAAFSRSGLQTFATSEAGYRYLSVGLSASWWF
jgi:tetratricopeptide (TPR) repeat protein